MKLNFKQMQLLHEPILGRAVDSAGFVYVAHPLKDTVGVIFSDGSLQYLEKGTEFDPILNRVIKPGDHLQFNKYGQQIGFTAVFPADIKFTSLKEIAVEKCDNLLSRPELKLV